MRPKKRGKALESANLKSVKKELAKPRMSRSARVAALDQEPARDAGPSSASLPGVVEKIIPARANREPEKAQISVEGTDPGYRSLRIENTLTNEHGEDVSLKKGSHVEVTVEEQASNKNSQKVPTR